MHTILTLLAGLLLLAVFLIFGRLWGGVPDGPVLAARLFLPVWLAVTLAHMWVGVTRAGFTVAQELPILAVNFALPAAAALAAAALLPRLKDMTHGH
ncbi:MAG: hypothetical protein KF887_13925 [Paracoccaceae bacterium]|nr:MAG: hypothetical protein KF887_13925 [Paracoccaceae bacterium]